MPNDMETFQFGIVVSRLDGRQIRRIGVDVNWFVDLDVAVAVAVGRRHHCGSGSRQANVGRRIGPESTR